MLVCGASLEILESCQGNSRRPGSGLGVTFGIRADPYGYTGVCGSGAQTCAGTEARGHVLALDAWSVPKGEVPSLWLIDESVDLLRGDECDILA